MVLCLLAAVQSKKHICKSRSPANSLARRLLRSSLGSASDCFLLMSVPVLHFLLIRMLSSHLVTPFRKLFIRHSCVFGNHLHFIALPFVRLLYLLYLLEVLLTNKTHLELSSLAISMALGDIPKAVAELPVALASSGLQKGVSYS